MYQLTITISKAYYNVAVNVCFPHDVTTNGHLDIPRVFVSWAPHEIYKSGYEILEFLRFCWNVNLLIGPKIYFGLDRVILNHIAVSD